jgi:putative flippase GtrA
MRKGIKRFIKYSIVGITTFAFDLLLLYFLIDFFLWNYILATGIAFTIAVSINYFFSRHFVFKGTLKSVHAGYFGFMSIACIGILIAMIGMWVFVDVLYIEYLYARIIIAIIVGIWNYIMNLYVNFKVAETHITNEVK